jgi:hypothetical protein
MHPEIALPPGYSIQLDYDPDASPLTLRVSVFRNEERIGEAHLIPGVAREGQLQWVLDTLTGGALPSPPRRGSTGRASGSL